MASANKEAEQNDETFPPSSSVCVFDGPLNFIRQFPYGTRLRLLFGLRQILPSQRRSRPIQIQSTVTMALPDRKHLARSRARLSRWTLNAYLLHRTTMPRPEIRRVNHQISGPCAPLSCERSMAEHSKAQQSIENAEAIDNRPLYCLKEYQKLVEPRQVVIRVRLHKWHRQFDRFLDHKATSNDGTSIRVRSHT